MAAATCSVRGLEKRALLELFGAGWKLQYKATRDAWRSVDFHEKVR